MRRRWSIAIAAVIGIACLAAILYSAQCWHTATAQRSAAVQAMHTTTDLARQVARLRMSQQKVEEHERPQQDVIARVNAIFSELGIPQTHFQGLSPESDVVVSSRSAQSTGPTIRRQSVRLTLTELQLAELGHFLKAWRQRNPMWIVTRIDLTHSRPHPRPRNARNEQSDVAANRYDIVLLLSALYLGEEESPA